MLLWLKLSVRPDVDSFDEYVTPKQALDIPNKFNSSKGSSMFLYLHLFTSVVTDHSQKDSLACRGICVATNRHARQVWGLLQGAVEIPESIYCNDSVNTFGK